MVRSVMRRQEDGVVHSGATYRERSRFPSDQKRLVKMIRHEFHSTAVILLYGPLKPYILITVIFSNFSCSLFSCNKVFKNKIKITKAFRMISLPVLCLNTCGVAFRLAVIAFLVV